MSNSRTIQPCLCTLKRKGTRASFRSQVSTHKSTKRSNRSLWRNSSNNRQLNQKNTNQIERNRKDQRNNSSNSPSSSNRDLNQQHLAWISRNLRRLSSTSRPIRPNSQQSTNSSPNSKQKPQQLRNPLILNQRAHLTPTIACSRTSTVHRHPRKLLNLNPNSK